MTLRPAEPFTITRVLEDHTDVDTHYVQSVIKNAATRATIATVNLVDRGGRYFSQNWMPLDSALGHYYVVIITTVYDDAGYTTKSQNYGQLSETYLIDNSLDRMTGGGGSSIDYKSIRKIVKEELAAIEIPEMPEQKDVDLNPVLNALDALAEQIDAIHIPDPVQPDFGPLEQGIRNVHSAVKGIQIPETDLSPAMQDLHHLKGAAAMMLEMIQEFHPLLASAAQTLDPQMRELVESKFSGIEDALAERLGKTITEGGVPVRFDGTAPKEKKPAIPLGRARIFAKRQ